MKFIVDNWLLILMAITSGGLLLWPQLRGGTGGATVAASEAVRLINREKGVVIDVCEPEEYAQGHAVGARNVPIGSLATTKNLPANKAQPLIVTCATGARSRRAAQTLRQMGYENVQVLDRGNVGWREANLPLERKAA